MGSSDIHANESETWFRTLLESAPDAMIIVDADGEITTVNNQALSMFGFDRDELLGQKVEMLLPEAARHRHEEHRASFAASPEVRPMGVGLDLLAQRKNGETFPVEISLSPVETESAKYVSSVIRDVTERKLLEQDIIAAHREAERANKANSAFLAAASHDLRQPVQALSLLNGALRRTVKEPRALEMIANQEDSLTAMTNLLNSLLDISRLDAGAVTPELEEFPMQRLIDRLSAEFARQAKHKGLGFESESCAATVKSDPNLLSEIIQNFISNAIRYTEKGTVTLRCIEKNGVCSVQVEDTGVGIADDQLQAIFAEFHQVKNPGYKTEGFGLGLAIVQRLVDLLGHPVDVESTPGRGSRFSLEVPALADPTNVADAEAGTATSGAGKASGLIMLIEDNDNVADAWGMLLEAEGYTVATSNSASNATELVKHLDDAPVLLISDFHLLDGSTGVEAVSAIRKHFDQDIPAFIVSGDTSKVVKDARLLENCTLMSKPINTARLLAAARLAVHSGRVPDD
jgi:PAS domain S-box-containing protein